MSIVAKIGLVRLINVMTALLAMGVLAISAATLWADRESSWSRATVAADNLLAALEGDITRTIHVYDLSLQGVIEGLRMPGLEAFTPEVQHKLLFDRAAWADYLGVLLVLDEAGDIVYDSQAPTPRQGNFSLRAYFQQHQANPEADLHISAPFHSKFSDAESIALSRRLSHPDGAFAGVVVGTLRLAYFRDAFERLQMGEQDSVELLRTDGALLMRRPYPFKGVIDQSGSVLPMPMPQVGQGSIQRIVVRDGVRRYVSMRRVDHLPLIVAAGLSTQDILAPWRRKTLVMAPITLLLCAGIVSLTFLFQRELSRRKRVEARLEQLAETDSLTGLTNRRYFDRELARAWQAARRSGFPLSLLFVDVDRFKTYNDRYGHQEGDEFLRKLGTSLRQAARRPEDVAARYGGEEFVILLPDTGVAGAQQVAEDLRAAVGMLAVPHQDSPTGFGTISIGVASARPNREADPDALVRRADDALYRAKRNGRDRVEVAPLPPGVSSVPT